MNETPKLGNVRITYVNMDGDGTVTFSGIGNDDRQNIEACANGAAWITVRDGDLVTSLTYRPPPAVTDEEMLPFWRPIVNGVPGQAALFDYTTIQFEEESGHSQAGIMIRYLCPFTFDPENYKHYADKLVSYGFNCSRTQRDAEGLFTEIWFLPGAWAAKGDLGDFIEEGVDGPAKTELAVEFLRRNVSFGTLDLTYKRLAAMNPD